LTGLGLFATKPIKKRARIAEYKGPLLDLKAAEKAENSGNRYLFEVNSRWTIDGSPRSNVARYVNHACDPNAEAVLTGGRMMFRAVKDIAAGAEITIDYGEEHVALYFKDGCRCASCGPR
jgi:SET domain-containing protein